MPDPTFKRVSLELFERLLDTFPFTRRINAVHMHHTWKPSRSEFEGHKTIVAMWRFHTRDKGWRDIAQHITIDPDGWIWLGRNWNLPPASAAGHNGNNEFGPFMFEMVGNFDKGCDPFDGQQRETALQVIALVQNRFGLASDSLRFHSAMSTKSCPGSSLDYAEIVAAVDARKTTIGARAPTSRQPRPGPFPDEPDVAMEEAMRSLGRSPFDGSEPADAELTHHEHDSILQQTADHQLGRGAREPVLSAAALAAMRPHVINLSMGRFSTDGQIASSAADVDAIFEQHLPTALEAAKADGRRLKIMFYAHGGLVSESSGLMIAAKHIDWWKQNGVYPIYFIWETGFHETLASLLKRAEQGATRGLPRDLWDYTLDPMIETAARVLRGPGIWGGMKSSAEHAIDRPQPDNPTGGGAWYVAGKLNAFCEQAGDHIELHAVGHSAGAIFHSYFLSAAHELHVPTFASLQFLAPAIRVDTFKALLADKIGDAAMARKLTIFTMKKDFEKADDCASIYHKSLLYLISNALEDVRATPILGLEESIRADAALKTLFGLAAPGEPHDGEVVWSVTASDSGASASTARSHGGFDDDAPTMDSVVRRVLGKADADRIVGYAGARDIRPAARPWIEDVDWPASISPAPFRYPAPNGALAAPSMALAPELPAPGMPYTEYQAVRGNRRALCVGIDRYPDPNHELAGCVADAHMWADTLRKLGFTTKLLTDNQASREALARELLALVEGSHVGDVIVFQYAGHGTMVPDLNGDEEDGQDEAICPVDFASGALYIDDDIAQVFGRLPAGVNLTCFMDCCHSGTNSRFAIGAPAVMPRAGQDERKRYIRATPELVQAHIRFRQQLGGSRDATGTGGRSLMPDVKFAACLDSEVAWESNGHGEFTVRTTRALAAGIAGLSNEQFGKQLTADFGVRTRQHPMLDCSLEARSRALLQPVSGNGAAAWPAAGAAGIDTALLAQTLSSLQQLLAHTTH